MTRRVGIVCAARLRTSLIGMLGPRLGGGGDPVGGASVHGGRPVARPVRSCPMRSVVSGQRRSRSGGRAVRT